MKKTRGSKEDLQETITAEDGEGSTEKRKATQSGVGGAAALRGKNATQKPNIHREHRDRNREHRNKSTDMRGPQSRKQGDHDVDNFSKFFQ